MPRSVAHNRADSDDGPLLEALATLEALPDADPRDWTKNWLRLRRSGVDKVIAKEAALAYRDANREPAETDRETAARLATAANLFHTADGVAFAGIDVGDHREYVPVRSRRFKSWLTLQFRAEKDKAPSTDALSVAQTEAEAIAELKGPQREVFSRLGYSDGTLYLDLCNDAWQVVEIDADGWRVLDESPVAFYRASDALPLPIPEPGTLEALRPFVNAPGEPEWAMVKAWLIGSLMPEGPYPLLNLLGEQGSAKSTTSRRLRSVIDPARTATRETPRNTHDLAIAAKRCHVLAFDNLSWLNAEMSDALCRLATGGGFAVRRLYTDDEESMFYSKRPVILNGISDVATRGDLLDRAIVVQLPPLDIMRDERTMDDEWTQAHPAILGGLLDAVSAALANWETVDLGDRAPRMADFARWVEASQAVPGFLDTYRENRADATGTELEASPFAAAVIEVAQASGEWEGSAAQLLDVAGETGNVDRHAQSWPRNATGASGQLRRLAPALRATGVQVDFRRSSGRRVIRLEAERSGGGLSV